MIYAICLFYSQLRTYLEYGLHHASISVMPNGILRVSILAKRHMRWKPGQHIFVRFLTLGLHSLTSHPFTICSLPNQSGTQPELVFFISPRGGLTSRLAMLAVKEPNKSIGVYLDGPYGAISVESLSKFGKALVIAGGSGAGFTLPLIEDVLRHLDSRQDGPNKTSATAL